MRKLAQICAWLALAGTLLPACLFLAGVITLDQTKLAMLVATILWFVSAPLGFRSLPGEDLAAQTGQVIVP